MKSKSGFGIVVAIYAMTIIAFLCAILIPIIYQYTATGRAIGNNQMFRVQKAMQASYAADVAQFQMYAESEDAERLGWAEQALMRANRTAAAYNEFILKNSFVWSGNIPTDIEQRLEYIQQSRDRKKRPRRMCDACKCGGRHAPKAELNVLGVSYNQGYKDGYDKGYKVGRLRAPVAAAFTLGFVVAAVLAAALHYGLAWGAPL